MLSFGSKFLSIYQIIIVKILAIIPARGGSKGIPRKNIKPLCGKPLIAWTIQQALSSASIDRVVVSTDDDEIAEISRDYGAAVPFRRPDEYSTDTSSTEDVMIHTVAELGNQGYHPDFVMLLQATCPVRYPTAIDAAVETLIQSKADSVVSATEIHPFIWKHPMAAMANYDFRHRPRRQDLGDDGQMFEENGSIYLTRTSILMNERCRLGGKIVIYPMSAIENIDIDTEQDFLFASAAIQILGQT